MKIQQIIDDIYSLNAHLQTFEKKYGLTSQDFYNLYSQGELDDGEFEQTRDFIEWAGFFRMKQQLEREFQTLSRQRVRAFRAGEAVLASKVA